MQRGCRHRDDTARDETLTECRRCTEECQSLESRCEGTISRSNVSSELTSNAPAGIRPLVPPCPEEECSCWLHHRRCRRSYSTDPHRVDLCSFKSSIQSTQRICHCHSSRRLGLRHREVTCQIKHRLLRLRGTSACVAILSLAMHSLHLPSRSSHSSNVSNGTGTHVPPDVLT